MYTPARMIKATAAEKSNNKPRVAPMSAAIYKYNRKAKGYSEHKEIIFKSVKSRPQYNTQSPRIRH